jgi:hypothetical protein
MRGFVKLCLILGIGFAGFCLVLGTMQSTSEVKSISHPETSEDAFTCTPAAFSLAKTRASVEYDYAKLTGIVSNHCKQAVGVQLKWTAFNSDGTVAFSQDFWPASTTNIPPTTDYPFEMMAAAPRGKWTYKVEPVALRQW